MKRTPYYTLPEERTHTHPLQWRVTWFFLGFAAMFLLLLITDLITK